MLTDRFTAGLDELTAKQARDPVVVLKTLDSIKRFSVFEATENQVIAKTMDMIFKRGYAVRMGGEFPWTNVELTDAGRALIAEAERAQGVMP